MFGRRARVEQAVGPLEVVIAGGGVGALEAALALRALAGERVRLTLLAPSGEFTYRPLAVLGPFVHRAPRQLPLAAIAGDVGAVLVRDAIAGVDRDRRLLYTEGHREVHYDALVIAVGARTTGELVGALRVDVAHMDRSLSEVIEGIDRGALRRLAVVVPWPTWPLGAYELALLAREHAAAQHKELAVTVVTAEQRPLGVFGVEVSNELAAILADAGITTIAGTEVQSASDGLVRMPAAGPLGFDRVVAFPKLAGPAIEGLPADADGFLPTSSSGEVIGAEYVYAAGDATNFPVKYGGVAAGQAGAVAASIAAAAGAAVAPALFDGVVHGFLIRGRAKPRHYFSVRIRAWGVHDMRVAEPAGWVPGSKIAARYLGPYLEERWGEGAPALAGLSSYLDAPEPLAIVPGERRVVIAGAGVAALEAVLALRAYRLPHLDIRVLAPGDSFSYGPVSVAEAFDLGTVRDFDLAAILSDQHVKHHADALLGVDVAERVLVTASGARLLYDELIVAVGARAAPALPGALTFRGRSDVPALRETLRDLAAGRIERLAFALPTGNAWPLPLYELALMAATFVSSRGLDARIVLVSCEQEPLGLFGSRASEAIAGLLRGRRIELHLPALARSFEDGVLHLAGGGSVRADRVIALPRLYGPAIEGLPHDDDGFIPIDAYGRVSGVDAVYAAGDATAFPLKQGGLGAQQADAIADMVAQRAGAAVQPQPFSPVIRGLLLTGGAPIYLRAGPGTLRPDSTVAGERQAPWPPRRRRVELSSSTSALWWPPSKIAGRYLAPYLATTQPATATSPLSDTPSLPDDVVRGEEGADAQDLALLLADYDARSGDYAQALSALDAAEALAGTLPAQYGSSRGLGVK